MTVVLTGVLTVMVLPILSNNRGRRTSWLLPHVTVATYGNLSSLQGDDMDVYSMKIE